MPPDPSGRTAQARALVAPMITRAAPFADPSISRPCRHPDDRQRHGHDGHPSGMGTAQPSGVTTSFQGAAASRAAASSRLTPPSGLPRLRRLVLSLALGLLAATAQPAGAETLRWSAQSELTGLDPHALQQSQAQAVLQHVYEGLTRYSPDLRIEPALATRWEQVTPLAWRFHLREGVRFHDGSPLTADDVQYSLERLKAAGSTVGAMLGNIRSVRRINDLTVDIILDRPMPLLPRILTDARILSRRWAREHKVDAVSGTKPDAVGYTARHANGTGSYRIEDGWAPGQPLQLQRHAGWWDTGGFPGNADTVVYQPVADDEARVQALLANRVDLVTDPASQRVPALKRQPALNIQTDVAQRTLLIGMDQFSDSLTHGQTGLRNPFKDQRVRHAMSLAIDTKALMQIGQGMYRPAGTIVAPGVTGWTPELDERPSASIRQARQLMRSAGFAQGFTVTLDCPNNRYAYDQELCKALVPMWRRIGIRVKVNSMPFASLVPKLETLDSSLWMLGWGSPDLDALQNLVSLAYTRSEKVDGAYNAARISDPALDRLINQARTENDPEARTRLLESALGIVKEQYYYLPLAHAMRAWAMRKPVTLLAAPGERPDMRFVKISPAKAAGDTASGGAAPGAARSGADRSRAGTRAATSGSGTSRATATSTGHAGQKATRASGTNPAKRKAARANGTNPAGQKAAGSTSTTAAGQRATRTSSARARAAHRRHRPVNSSPDGVQIIRRTH